MSPWKAILSTRHDDARPPTTSCRMYPFALGLNSVVSTVLPGLELHGTEHDNYQFVTVPELERLDAAKCCVPGLLLQAFHHATHGIYDSGIHSQVRPWASDQENGASVMVHNALHLLSHQAQQQ
jgi:hypothetical protein